MSVIAEMKHRIKDRAGEIRSLLLGAEAEKRKLTRNEETRKAALYEEIALEEARIKDQEKLEAVLKDNSAEGRSKVVVVRDESDRGALRSGAVYRDLQTGAEYRALKHNERTARASGEALSPGKFLRGALLGNWDGADAELRAYQGNVGASGGFLLPEVLSSLFIDEARNQARVMQAGAQTLVLPNRSVRIAQVTRDAAASYKQENEAATDTDMQFGYIQMEARTLVAYATLSMEILQDALNLDQIVQNAFGQALGLEMDRAALLGVGVAGEPQGLYYTPGVGEVSPNANGFVPADYDEFSEAIADVEGANGVAVAAIYSPRTAQLLRELKETGNNQYIAAPEFFTNLKRFTTNQIPNDMTYGSSNAASAAFVGDFSQLLFGMRQEIRFDTSNVAAEAWEKYQFKIRATARFDIAVLRPAHFSIIKGIKPS